MSSKDFEAWSNVGKNNALLGDLDGCLSDAERKLLGFTTDDSRDQEMRARAEQLVEDDIATSQQHLPLSHTRSTDRKDLRPWQGKESDSEIMFNFESLVDAQDLYDFVLETQLVVPGEVKLKVHGEGAGAQYSVHFASNVLVMKPEVIQAAMMAYQDQLGEGCEAAWNTMFEAVDAALTEREERKPSERGSAEPRSTGRGKVKGGTVDFNPFHDKAGIFTSREGLADGGSWSDGKKVRLKATKKGPKLHFAGTKRPCGREARGQGKDIRCWDGKPGLGFKVADMIKQKLGDKERTKDTPMPARKKEDWDAADLAVLREAWELYGIVEPLREATGMGALLRAAEDVVDEAMMRRGCPPGHKMVFGKCVKPDPSTMSGQDRRKAMLTARKKARSSQEIMKKHAERVSDRKKIKKAHSALKKARAVTSPKAAPKPPVSQAAYFHKMGDSLVMSGLLDQLDEARGFEQE